MRRLQFRICALAVLAAASIWCADIPKRVSLLDPARSAEFEKAPRIAIVVGVGSYPPESGFGRLKYAAADAVDLGDRLKLLGYKVVSLVDERATRAILKKYLDDLVNTIDNNDGTVVFFFSGHGFQREGRNYLATYESALSDLGSTGLAVSDVEESLRKAGAPRRVLWLDACRNDVGTGAKGAAPDRSFSTLSSEKGTLILYSAAATKQSYESDQLKHGVFTHFLLRGLEGNAAGTDSMITFDDLQHYVVPQVREYSFEQGQDQVPQRAGEASGDFLIAKGGQVTGNVNQGASNGSNSPSAVLGSKNLRDQYAALRARADTATEWVENRRSESKALGVGVSPSILAPFNTMKTKLSQAAAEMTDRKDSEAQQSLNDAEKALQELEKRSNPR